GRRLERSLLLTSVTVAVGVLLLTAVFFFILPRFSTGYMSAYGFQQEQISGFSDEVSLGDIGSIKQNPAVVMRVRAEEGDAQQLEGLKWRGLALTRFDGHRWQTQTRAAKLHLDARSGHFYLPRDPLRDLPPHAAVPARRIHYRVLLEPISANTLFAAAVPLELFGRIRRLDVDATGSLLFYQRGYGQTGYDVVSDIGRATPELLRAASTDYPTRLRETYLQLPPLDPRLPELARQVTSRFDNPYDKARELERYFRTQFGYTLELPRTPEQDPLANFLFVRRRGHCEYFAASMTVLLRTLGIPARMVNGFLTGEYNEIGGDYVVRALDAHTWVEVYFPRIGWVEFDPTPPDPNPPGRAWWTTARNYFDAFDLWWDEWVINYDEIHQVQLARQLREAMLWARDSRRWFRQKRRDLTAELNQWGERIRTSPYSAPAGVALVFAALLAFRGRALRNWLKAAWLLRGNGGRALNPAEATLVYTRLLAFLRRKGYRKTPAQTPLEFAALLPPPELAGRVNEFTRLYNDVRFGGGLEASARLIALLREVQTWKASRQPRP
ncbi:MAG: transglutaminase TgpA family protein, partial [Candidatus Acidiferrales bacterium]